jgi:hypothetical protein
VYTNTFIIPVLRDKLKSLQRGDFKIWVASFNNLPFGVMERCVYKHIHNYLLENNIIINNQSGFRKGDLAIYQLINITNEFGKA